MRLGGFIGRFAVAATHMSVQAVGITAATVIAFAVPVTMSAVNTATHASERATGRAVELATGVSREGVQLGRTPVMRAANKLARTEFGPINLGVISPTVSVERVLRVPVRSANHLSTRVSHGVLLPWRPICALRSGCGSTP